MLRNPDHVTVAVADAASAIEFFALLGFRKQHVAMIDGGRAGAVHGHAGHEGAAHHARTRRSRASLRDPVARVRSERRRTIRVSTRRICGDGATTTLRSASTTSRPSAAHLVANGVKMLSDEMDYISRRLRFFEGPEGITLELVQWVDAASDQQ